MFLFIIRALDTKTHKALDKKKKKEKKRKNPIKYLFKPR